MKEILETKTAEHANTLASATYAAYGNSFDKLSEMEHTLCHLFGLLESSHFFSILCTLSYALDCPIRNDVDFHGESDLDYYTQLFMYEFEDTVLSIGMDEQEE